MKPKPRTATVPATSERGEGALAVRQCDAAALLGVSVSYLRALGRRGEGPRCFKSGRARLYPMFALQDWLSRGLSA